MDGILKHLKEYTPKPLGETYRYAVLLPLVWENNAWQVLYQIRSQYIPQPGEVSFPGGRLEAGESYEQAAVRETIEELGVREDQIEILGEIDYLVYQERTIHCFVARLQIEDWRQLPFNEEVERLFTVSLDDLLESPPIYHELAAEVISDNGFPFDRITNGKDYDFSHHKRLIPFYENLSENIWGMTAQLTHRFIEIISKKD